MSETDNKNTPEDLCIIKRFTKQQVREVHKLFEEGKTLEEISLFFQKKYKCKPIPISRLRHHLTRYYKLKRMSESGNGDVENNKNHSLQPPVSIITNQDIRELKEKMLSPSPANTLYSSENVKTVSNVKDDGLPGIPLKFLVFVVIVVLLLLKILMRRTEKEKKESKSKPGLQSKSENLSIKWV